MTKHACGAADGAALPELPVDVWANIAQAAWRNLPEIGTARLVCKYFCDELRRVQHNEVFKALVDKRSPAHEADRVQRDAPSGASRAERSLVRAVEFAGDARLFVFFKLLIHKTDGRTRRELRIQGINALREANEWFESADLR